MGNFEGYTLGRPCNLDQIVFIRRMIEYGFEALPQCIMYLIALEHTLSLSSTSEIIGSNITNITINGTSTNNNLSFSNTVIWTQLISLSISTLSIHQKV